MSTQVCSYRRQMLGQIKGQPKKLWQQTLRWIALKMRCVKQNRTKFFLSQIWILKRVLWPQITDWFFKKPKKVKLSNLVFVNLTATIRSVGSCYNKLKIKTSSKTSILKGQAQARSSTFSRFTHFKLTKHQLCQRSNKLSNSILPALLILLSKSIYKAKSQF